MPADWIEILPTPLPVSTAIARISSGAAGGIAIFIGTTRDESGDNAQKLISLDYEAYVEMALAQMRELAGAARKKWPVVSLAMLHRIGRVNIAEPSVLIAVACPHRAEAFEACRFLIDKLKAEVTIWKKEVWADGNSTWVDPNSS